jgi:Protein of unknown function (DUF2569)
MTPDPIDQTPVNLLASDSTENKQVDQKKYKKIRGWLIFLIITLMFLTPGTGARLLDQTDKAYREYVSLVPAPETLDTTLNIYKVPTRILMGLSFISGLLLLLKLRIGVTTTKLFLIANVTAAVVLPVLMLMVDSQERINQLFFKEGLTEIPARLIVSAAWYAYLVKSKRVAAVYGLKN